MLGAPGKICYLNNKNEQKGKWNFGENFLLITEKNEKLFNIDDSTEKLRDKEFPIRTLNWKRIFMIHPIRIFCRKRIKTKPQVEKAELNARRIPVFGADLMLAIYDAHIHFSFPLFATVQKSKLKIKTSISMYLKKGNIR